MNGERNLGAGLEDEGHGRIESQRGTYDLEEPMPLVVLEE